MFSLKKKSIRKHKAERGRITMSSDKVKLHSCVGTCVFFPFFKSYTCDFVKGLKLNLSFCVGRFLKKSNLREKQHIEIVGQLYAHIIPVVP